MKETATAFLTLAASGKVQEAYDKYVAANFRHHNAYFKGDRQSLLDAMAEAHVKQPNEIFEIKQLISEGDRVAAHSWVKKANGMSIAVVHWMRFENGKIAELWDVGQILDPKSPNENGPF